MIKFPSMPKMDGPDGLIGGIQKVGASFDKMSASFDRVVVLLESIDRRLGRLEEKQRDR